MATKRRAPGEGTEPYALASNLPVYGTGDAGRRFYKAFRALALASGVTDNRIMKSLYAYSKDGEIMVTLGTHVDDLVYADRPD